MVGAVSMDAVGDASGGAGSLGVSCGVCVGVVGFTLAGDIVTVEETLPVNILVPCPSFARRAAEAKTYRRRALLFRTHLNDQHPRAAAHAGVRKNAA